MRELETLQARYPFRRAYRYDAESTLQRGRQRAAEILALPAAAGAVSFLEIACSDGMVSAMLQRAGRAATAIDCRASAFDPRAQAAGARLLEMDAEALAFEDASFDFAFSYNAFEHFPDPERVLGEMARVVRPGGGIYLRFGPLYDSPWGQHAYRTITVPYCQFLFPADVMNAYAVARGLKPIDVDHVNRWPLERYRGLWTRFGGTLETTTYAEERDLSCLDVIARYPSCFKRRAHLFDSFVVSRISTAFRKR